MTAPSSSGRKKKILVVDDESTIVAYLTTVLEDNGYETFSASNAEAALAIAREQLPDLMTLDIMMPRQSGIALYQQLKLDPELRKIPVVFVTAFSRLSDVGPAAFHKMIKDERVSAPEAYIEKPVVVAEFVETVGRLIELADPGAPPGGGQSS